MKFTVALAASVLLAQSTIASNPVRAVANALAARDEASVTVEEVVDASRVKRDESSSSIPWSFITKREGTPQQ